MLCLIPIILQKIAMLNKHLYIQYKRWVVESSGFQKLLECCMPNQKIAAAIQPQENIWEKFPEIDFDKIIIPPYKFAFVFFPIITKRKTIVDFKGGVYTFPRDYIRNIAFIAENKDCEILLRTGGTFLYRGKQLKMRLHPVLNIPMYDELYLETSSPGWICYDVCDFRVRKHYPDIRTTIQCCDEDFTKCGNEYCTKMIGRRLIRNMDCKERDMIKNVAKYIKACGSVMNNPFGYNYLAPNNGLFRFVYT